MQMRKFQTVLLALVAMVALGAMFASAASAETTLAAEWLIGGAKITTAQSSETTGEILLEDSKAGAAVVCSGILDGTVGPAAADQITKVLNLKGEEISSTPLSGLALLGTGSGAPDCRSEATCAEGSASSPIEVWPENLPWTTELVLMENGEFLDRILKSGYDLLCLILGINTSDLCEAAETTLPVVNNAGGFAETPGGKTAEPLATCSVGGEGSGVNETVGAATIKAASGSLAVSE
jgi:hypothetical protein